MPSVKTVNTLPMVWVPVAQTGWRSSSWKSTVPKSFLTCWRESSSPVWPGPMMARGCSTTHTRSRMGRVTVCGCFRDACYTRPRGFLMAEKEAHLIAIVCPTCSHCSSIAVHKYTQSSYQAYSLKISHCSLLYIWLYSLTTCGPGCSGSLEAAGRLVIVIGFKRPCLIAVILLFLFYFILFFGAVCKSLSDCSGGVYDWHKQFMLCFLPAFLREWVSLKTIKHFLHFGNIIYCPDSLVRFHNEKIKFSL